METFHDPMEDQRVNLLSKKKLVFVLLICLLVSVPIVTMTLDFSIAKWCWTHQSWGKPWDELRKLIILSELFGHGWGAVFVGFAVYSLDPARRRDFVRLALAVVASGLAPNAIKLILVRYRPRYFFGENFPGVAENIQQTFGGFHAGFSSNFQSFPSGHSALAWGLATVLIRLYPHGKIFFATMASLVMVQRVVVCAHFPSDTLAGAALGIFVATLCMPSNNAQGKPRH